jgi:Holliday junction resolvase-like predicted endonuclease
MAPLKQKGDLAEMLVAADLVRRGYKVAFPFGEDWDYDLIVERGGRLERVQVKYTESDGAVICVRARTHSLTNGRVIAVKRYTAAMIDWLAVYDRTSDRCYYICADVLGDGMNSVSLRLTAARNRQQKGVRLAADHLELEVPSS